jgi:biopolymer transport protein ExbD
MQFTRKRRRPPMINIIPLIDVLVVLLIFYIATTVFKKPEPKIKIVVPDSSRAKATQDTPPTILYVTNDGKFFLGDEAVEPDKLADILKSKLAADPNFKVAMKADTKAAFGDIVKVMDAAHAAGMGDLPTFMNTEKGGAGGDSGQ